MKIFIAILFLSLCSASSFASTLDIKSDGETMISSLKLESYDFSTEARQIYLNVYLQATSSVSNCWYTLKDVVKSRVTIVYPKNENGEPAYLLSAIPGRSSSCSWDNKITLRDRFLIKWQDDKGQWRDNFSRETGAIYLVKSLNGNGNLFSTYHLDMKDPIKTSLQLMDNNSVPVIDAEKLSTLVFK
jgi:hypothetical protein